MGGQAVGRWWRKAAAAALLGALAALATGGAGSALAREPGPDAGQAGTAPVVNLGDLPAQAQQTHQLIHAGGPFPYSKDGSVFGNRERRLPLKARGYYREYTVATPGARNQPGPEPRHLLLHGRPLRELLAHLTVTRRGIENP
jgi:ribonuclease T1